MPHSQSRLEFRSDERGATAIIFALSVFMLFGLAGAAVDFHRATDAKSTLQHAADAAALAAIKDTKASDATVAETATKFFASNMKYFIGQSVPAVAVTRTAGNNPTVTVKLSYVSPNGLLSAFGFKSFTMDVVSTAATQMRESEIYAAIDMSESMTIAADDAERDKLRALTAPYLSATVNPEGCAFGCHSRDGWEPAGKTVYQMAKEANIKLREDVLAHVFGEFVDSFLDTSDPDVAANRKRIGVIGFSSNAKLLRAATNDAAAVKTATALFPPAERTNTLFDVALPQIKTMIGAQGSGFTGSPKKTLLIVTDGVRWMRNATGFPNGPIDINLCQQFKSAGIDVAVIEVVYQEDKGEHWFETLVRADYDKISPRLKDCASPGFYFQAKDSDVKSLAAAFEAANEKLTPSISLTQ